MPDAICAMLSPSAVLEISLLDQRHGPISKKEESFNADSYITVISEKFYVG